MLVSCTHTHTYTGRVPGTFATYQMAADKYYPVGLTSIAIELFYKSWVEKFSDPDEKVKKSLDNARILWIKNSKGSFKYEDAELWGQTDNEQKVIKVVVRNTDRSISATSLIHELVHVANFSIHGSFDIKHSDSENPIWNEEHDHFINKTNKQLCTLEDQFYGKEKTLTGKIACDKVGKIEE